MKASLLATTCTAILMTLISTLITTIGSAKPPVPSVQPFRFPTDVPLENWRYVTSGLVNAERVQPPAYVSGNYISGKRYQYQQQQTVLTIEMRYLANTDGDLKNVIKAETGDLQSVLYYQEDSGFYSVFHDRSHLYLTSCINPHGMSTVTSDQFKRNRSLHDLRLDHLIDWTLGRGKIHDRRCLWTHASTPLQDYTSPEIATKTLEDAWFSWYSWWSVNFPKPTGHTQG